MLKKTAVTGLAPVRADAWRVATWARVSATAEAQAIGSPLMEYEQSIRATTGPRPTGSSVLSEYDGTERSESLRKKSVSRRGSRVPNAEASSAGRTREISPEVPTAWISSRFARTFLRLWEVLWFFMRPRRSARSLRRLVLSARARSSLSPKGARERSAGFSPHEASAAA